MMFLSHKGPTVGQSKVALDVNPVCKGLFVLNVNARMLKQSKTTKEKNNLYITILFQTFNIKQVPLISKTI